MSEMSDGIVICIAQTGSGSCRLVADPVDFVAPRLAEFTTRPNLFQPLLLLIADATQNELAQQVGYLKDENEILRSKNAVRRDRDREGEEPAGQCRP